MTTQDGKTDEPAPPHDTSASGSSDAPDTPASPQAEGEAPSETDAAFMESVLNEISNQNEQAKTSAAQTSSTDSASGGGQSVRVTKDTEFRTPEGVASARAYLSARPLAPIPAASIDPESVRVVDPRKLPTMRLPREMREKVLEKEAQAKKAKAAGRKPRSAPVDEGGAPTLRSALSKTPKSQKPQTRTWLIAVIIVALVAALVVALATRLSQPQEPKPPPVG